MATPKPSLSPSTSSSVSTNSLLSNAFSDTAKESVMQWLKDAASGSNSMWFTAGTVFVGATTALMTATAVKSIVNMLFWRKVLRVKKTGKVAPGPTPIPLLGNVVDLSTVYYETLHRYVDEDATVFWVHATPFLVVNEEEGLRRVLGGARGLYTKPKYFGYKSKTVTSAVDAQRDEVANESLEYNMDGDSSRVALDAMVREAFPKIKRRVHTLLRSLETPSREDAVHAVRRAIVALNLDVLFGASCQIEGINGKKIIVNKSENDKKPIEDARRISNMIDFAGSEFARRMVIPMKMWFDFISNLRFAFDVVALISLGRRLGRSLDEAAEDVQAGSAPQGVSWVHAWVGKVGRIGKLGKVVGLLMASTQTVPLTAVWLLHELSGHEFIRRRLREELQEANIQSIMDLDYSSLEKLPFLDAVVKETLRLYPPFPLIQRQAQQDDVLCGITIPQDMIVFVVPWLVHRNERYWKHPHDFIPDRFLHGSSTHGDAPSDWVYIPFGRGARMCAGSKLALAELKVLAVHAILSFEWQSKRVRKVRDERFPELGMVPRGIRIQTKSNQKVKQLDSLL